MTYPKKLIIKNISPGMNYQASYPYIDATSYEDMRQNQRVLIIGLVDEGDTVSDKVRTIDFNES